MKKVAKFEKVSFSRFVKDMEMVTCSQQELQSWYDELQLPRRATKGSAGYDFTLPFDADFIEGTTITIPTGIRVKIDEDWVLQCYPRSGLGFKYGLVLVNTVGIIDSDFYHSMNEGHIFVKMMVSKSVKLNKGDRFMQGIFMPYGIVVDDDVIEERVGGLGSTGV